MIPATSQQPRGQILLVVAVGMIVLLGVAALVVDLGFSYMLRRQEQNAADPASLAAARFISWDPVTGYAYNATNGWDAACRYVHMNGFFDDANTTCATQADGTYMKVNWPPVGTVDDYWHGDLGHVQVIVSAQQASFFGGIFGVSRATVTAGAVAARQFGNTNSHSLVALRPNGCGAAKTHGNSVISIYPAPGYTGDGGYVQVNSDCGSTTGDNDCRTSDQGALELAGGSVLKAPRVDVHGGCKGDAAQPACPTPPGACNTGTGPLDEAAVQIGDPLGGLQFPKWDTTIPGARCGATAPQTTPAGAEGCGPGGGGRIPWAASPDSMCPGMNASWDCVVLQPGVYYGGWNIGNKTNLTLAPGIYVIAGGGIGIGSTGSLDSLAGGSSPAPVLFYNTDNPTYASSCPGAGAKKCQSSLDLTATANLKVAGLLPDQPCPPVTTTGGCPFGGMVIWYDGDGSQPTSTNASCASGAACIEIEGGAELFISGTIYAPRAHVKIEGNAGTNCSGTATQTAAVQSTLR